MNSLYKIISLACIFLSFASQSLQILKKPSEKEITDEKCFSASPYAINFTSSDHAIHLNGYPFIAKGTSWWGFETTAYVTHGLWAVSWSSLLDFMSSNQFNFWRIPFSCELVAKNPYPDPNTVDYNLNSELVGKTSLEVMDFLIDQAGYRGIFVMLDMHLLECGPEPGFWYDDEYSADQNQQTWQTMINRYSSKWNVVAMDVFNEPYSASWGNGDPNTDWKMWVEKIGNMAHDMGTDWLINVEGIANGCNPGCFWGENLMGVQNQPIQLKRSNKVVYSPHVYGPDVYDQPYFSDPNFPQNMPAIWDAHWGYIAQNDIPNSNNSAIMIGEWGGSASGQNGEWETEMVSYLKSINSIYQFFWCVNPDSGDTGGLLENDWTTPDYAKLNNLQSLVPNPTQVSYNGGQVCINV